jgi:chemotaxis protein MotA
MYFDDVALAMVVGGTIAIGIVTMPWHNIGIFGASIKKLLFHFAPSDKQVVKECLEFIKAKQENSKVELSGNSIAKQLLRDGEELISLGFSIDEIQTILQERLFFIIQKEKETAQFFTGLAKYPPAFGLVGTVLGLVNLMRAITEGLNPSETGIKMALALVATLYGLIVANFIIAPIGEGINKRVTVDQFQGEICLQAVLLLVENVSLLKSQEMLNSFVTRDQRIDLIGSLVGTKRESA